MDDGKRRANIIITEFQEDRIEKMGAEVYKKFDRENNYQTF